MNTSRLRTRLSNSSGSEDGDGGSAVTPVLAIGSLIAVAASTIGSVLAYGVVPDPVRIHWTMGMGSYYGPEFAPAAVVLAAFPLAAAGIAVSASWLGRRFGDSDALRQVRPYYTAAVLGTLAIVLATQAAVVLANLG